jgi:pilus assembly protein CpaB
MTRRALDFARRAWEAAKARRTAWLALGALAFGAIAVLGARSYIGERLALEKARLQPRQEMVDVVVAKRELRRGERIGAETMAVRALPRDVAPGGAVTPATFEAVSGQRLAVPLRAGEPLLASAVASVDAAPISSRVRPGIRAMTISVDEVNSLSGMLQPGDRIDLLLSVRPPAAHGAVPPEVTRTVMQGVTVMATGRQARASTSDELPVARAFTSITVEVDPEQAQRLVVAQRSGKLTAVLRNPEDRTRIEERRLDVNALLGLPAPAAVVVAGPPAVEVIVGGRGQAPARSGAPTEAPLPAAAGPAPAADALASPAPPAANSEGGPARPGSSRATGVERVPPSDLPWTPSSPATVPLYR